MWLVGDFTRLDSIIALGVAASEQQRIKSQAASAAFRGFMRYTFHVSYECR